MKKNKTLKVVVILPQDNIIQMQLINNDLKSFYETLKCDTIDIVRYKINGKYFRIICDDTGLLKFNPIPSLMTLDCQPILVGNLIITGDELTLDGNLTSLTDKEIQFILDERNIVTSIDLITNEVTSCLINGS